MNWGEIRGGILLKNLILDGIDSSWISVFEENFRYLNDIDNKISMSKFNPDKENIFRFAQNPLENIKIVIVGQDTYPAPGVATGRAFEVGNLRCWNEPFRQVSLKNIVRLLYGSYTEGSSYESFNEIRKKIQDGSFNILSPDLLFEDWEKQGVLLLNCALTCEINIPGSHSEIWKPFMDEIFKYFCKNNKDAIFFLWGSVAGNVKPLIDDGRKIYISRHPMMCSDKYPDDFLKSRCFYDTKNLINWLGGAKP